MDFVESCEEAVAGVDENVVVELLRLAGSR
jgi:hypothetical protein